MLPPHAACAPPGDVPLEELGIVLLCEEIPLLWGCHYNL